MPPAAALYLQDGRAFFGRGFGAKKISAGELVFTTSMTGYTESLTDPSYCGQVLVFTNPLIGNYGFETHRMESPKVQVAGVVISELSRVVSNSRTRIGLHEVMSKAGVPGIEGVDTRRLAELLRDEGCQNGVLSPADIDGPRRRKIFKQCPDMSGLDLSGRVTTEKVMTYIPRKKSGLTVALIDFGVKRNIIQELLNAGAAVRRFPASSTPEEILSARPDGILLSNGPGDPGAMTGAIARIRLLVGRLPVFGICLGHQLLGLAAGLKTYKLKFGHRGSNHPVQDIRGSRVRSIAITTQNHGFSVRPPKSSREGVVVTHRSLYDGTVEGLELPGKNAFAVQFHPEATPGPNDSLEIFGKFLAMCGNGKGR